MSTTESSALSRHGVGMVLCLALATSLLLVVFSGGYGYIIERFAGTTSIISGNRETGRARS
jgi:hypothetical protein